MENKKEGEGLKTLNIQCAFNLLRQVSSQQQTENKQARQGRRADRLV